RTPWTRNSHCRKAADETVIMNEKPGSVFGGMLLIAGSCIGAGMLALPILTGLSGFFPSLAMFICAWCFMTITGFLLVEVNGWFDKRVNIISMAQHSLGDIGRGLGWILYLFLFYSLLVAYTSLSGHLVSSYFQNAFEMMIPSWIGSFFFVFLFGWIVYLGTRPVDLWNRCLMVGKVVTYLGLVLLGARYVQVDNLLRKAPSLAVFSLPVLFIAFGYHNMIPSLTSYMRGDLRRVRLTILGGSLITLTVYLIWQYLILGIVPLEGSSGILDSLKNDKDASQALTGVLGMSWVSSFGSGLAFFAILTSFLAQALALVHFLADGLKIDHKRRENIFLCALALLPPLLCSIIYPQLFFKALNFAGGICTAILFGILPVCMVWVGRYKKGIVSSYEVFGGKPLLLAVFLFSLFIIFFQLSSMFGASYIPKP
ncbi:MAG: amino acid permease, partial [Anaerolineae bacterium]